MRPFTALFALFLVATQCGRPPQRVVFRDPKIAGLNLVAPPRPFGSQTMADISGVAASWVAIIPYAFCRIGEAKVHYRADGQWWGERPEGVAATIDSARKVGLKIMLKPQVYVPDGWTGNIDFATETDWQQWEADYEKYLMIFVDIAAQKQAEMLCIGTEFGISAKKRPQFWQNLIEKIRKKYNGKLTYAANWDDYPTVTFWPKLDFVGVDAYFPLTDSNTPDVATLQKKWKLIAENLQEFSEEQQRPILFTEFGYLSVDGCAGKTWELEKNRRTLAANPTAQANALEALFSTFWGNEWWAGGFLWKWYPENRAGREQFTERDYTPQKKEAEKTVRKWYLQK